MIEISCVLSLIFAVIAPIVTIIIMQGYYKNKCNYEIDGDDIYITVIVVVASVLAGFIFGLGWFIIVPCILIGISSIRIIFPEKAKDAWIYLKELVSK